MIPARLTSPTVGLMPTRLHAWLGDVMEPSVSVPTATAQRFAATAAPEPLLEPDGERSRTYGLRHCPPRPLQPLMEWRPRKFAHSLRLVLPRITAPASRRRRATPESRGAMDVASASEPALVCIRSAVPTLSLTSTGTPCSGPRGPFDRRSASSASAMESASGFSSTIARRFAPFWSLASMRARYCSARPRAVQRPLRIPSWSCTTVTSSRSEVPCAAARLAARSLATARDGRARSAAASAPPSTLVPRNVRRVMSSRVMSPPGHRLDVQWPQRVAFTGIAE